MPNRLTLTAHPSTDDLERAYRACRDPVERSHWQMVWLVSQGYTCPVVARLTGYRADTVRTVIHRYNEAGPPGIVDRRHANPGQPPLVPPAVREELRTVLAESPPDGGLWTGPKVAAWLTKRLDRAISPQRAWEVLQRIGLTLHQPRPRATTADPAAQTAFKGGSVTPSILSGRPTPQPS